MSGFDPFADAGPRWYAVPAHRPFLEDLAAGVLSWLGDLPPETLSDATILLPNRRAARAFTAALARQANGRAMLLPQVRPLGDLEEDEPPFTPGALGLDLPPAIADALELRRRGDIAGAIAKLDADAAGGPVPDRVALFRQSLLLAGGAEPNNQQVEVLLSSALEACEQYYQAFQFVVWSGLDAKSAIEAVMFETVGEA